MNAQQIFLIAIVVSATSVFSRKLNVAQNLVPPGIFDETIFSSFQSSVGPQVYAFQDNNILVGLSAQVGDLVEGAFANFVGADNTDGGASSIVGSNSLSVIGDDTESSVKLSSSQTATSNGPGKSLIQNIGTGTANFVGGGSTAGFDFSANDFSESDTNATSNTVVDASAVARDGFSQSIVTACAGSSC